APRSRVLAPMIMPEADHVIEYHVVAAGACWAGLIGEPPRKVEAGHLVIFPQGDAHALSDPPGLRSDFDAQVFSAARRERIQLPFNVVANGGGAPAHIVCGFLGCDTRPFNPLLASLPRILIINEPSDTSDG